MPDFHALELQPLLTSQYAALSSVSSDHTNASARPLLENPLFGIDGSLKRLEKVAAVILQATQGSLIRRAVVFAKNHNDFEEICRIFSRIILARYHVFRPENTSIFIDEDLIPSKDDIMAPRPASLFLALVKSSVVRHFRILYERGRRDREKTKHSRPEDGTRETQGSKLLEEGKIERRPIQQRPSGTTAAAPNYSTDVGDETKSENQPTLLSIDVDEYKKGIARTDSDSLGPRDKPAPPISEAGVAFFPPAPKISDGEKEAACPICQQVFPAEELRGGRWM